MNKDILNREDFVTHPQAQDGVYIHKGTLVKGCPEVRSDTGVYFLFASILILSLFYFLSRRRFK
jgi:hypothetical protein